MKYPRTSKAVNIMVKASVILAVLFYFAFNPGVIASLTGYIEEASNSSEIDLFSIQILPLS